jgi:hypothetical protein
VRAARGLVELNTTLIRVVSDRGQAALPLTNRDKSRLSVTEILILAKKPTITVNRSAITGKFVTENYADKHPRTTETEHYKRSLPKKGGGKGKR